MSTSNSRYLESLIRRSFESFKAAAVGENVEEEQEEEIHHCNSNIDLCFINLLGLSQFGFGGKVDSRQYRVRQKQKNETFPVEWTWYQS